MQQKEQQQSQESFIIRVYTKSQLANHRSLRRLISKNRMCKVRYHAYSELQIQRSQSLCKLKEIKYKQQSKHKILQKLKVTESNTHHIADSKKVVVAKVEVRKLIFQDKCRLPKFACGSRMAYFQTSLLVVGGYCCQSFPDKPLVMEIQGSFQKVQVQLKSIISKGDFPPPNLISHEIVECKGALYLYGGYSPFPIKRINPDLFCFNERLWRKVKPINFLSLRRHFSLLSSSNFLIFVGGLDERNQFVKSIDILNINSNFVNQLQLKRESGYSHQRSVLVSLKGEDFIYSFGGMNMNEQVVSKLRFIKLVKTDIDVNLEKDQWTFPKTSGVQPQPRIDFIIQYLKQPQNLLIHGGRNLTALVASTNLIILGLNNHNWIRPVINGLAIKAFGHCSCVIGSQVFIFGGYSSDFLFRNDIICIQTQKSKGNATRSLQDSEKLTS